MSGAERTLPDGPRTGPCPPRELGIGLSAGGTGLPNIYRISDIVWGTPRAAAFVQPIAPRRAASSLTDWLTKSPDFIDALLPKSRRALTSLNKFLTKTQRIEPCSATRDSKLYSRVALAVDRGAVHLSGADVVTRPLKYLRSRRDASELAAAVLTLIESYRPPVRAHFRRPDYLGWLYLLGGLDTAQRGCRPISDVETRPLPATISRESAKAWLASSVTGGVGDEIACLLRAVRDCRLSGQFIGNPAFGGPGPYLASDGDWISGDTLVELKCVMGGVQRIHIAQLLCYYMSDGVWGERCFTFSRLALCLPRQQATVTGTADEWLAAFGGAPAEVVIAGVRAYWEGP